LAKFNSAWNFAKAGTCTSQFARCLSFGKVYFGMELCQAGARTSQFARCLSLAKFEWSLYEIF